MLMVWLELTPLNVYVPEDAAAALFTPSMRTAERTYPELAENVNTMLSPEDTVLAPDGVMVEWESADAVTVNVTAAGEAATAMVWLADTFWNVYVPEEAAAALFTPSMLTADRTYPESAENVNETSSPEETVLAPDGVMVEWESADAVTVNVTAAGEAVTAMMWSPVTFWNVYVPEDTAAALFTPSMRTADRTYPELAENVNAMSPPEETVLEPDGVMVE
jgi:hypothetical protein